MGVRVAVMILGCSVVPTVSPSLNSFSSSFSPGRMPVNSIAMSLSGSSPESRIMSLASSTIGTGSPMFSTKISPPLPMDPA